MPLFTETITLGVKADMTPFERDVLSTYSKLAGRLKPLDIRMKDGVSQPLGKITGDISQFNKSIDAAAARVLAFTSTVGIVNGVVNSFRALVRETIDVQKSLTDINVVMNASSKELENFGASLFDIARNTGQSFKAVADAAVEFSRQGLSMQETIKRTNDALILSRLSGLDAADAVKTLTAAMNGFGKEALNTTDIINKLAQVDSSFAVSTKDLSEALTRVGSTADDANVSFNELIATVTAVQQTTSRGGAVIGNALKTIFTRLSRDSTITQLRELGVAIDESQGGIEKLRNIATAVKQVDTATANTIKELAGGVFQINVVSAALGDLGKEYSIYGNALEVANARTGDAVLRNQALNQTLDALTKTAGTNIDELLSKIGKISLGNNLKDIFSSFNSVTKFLSESLDGEGIGASIGKNILTGIGNFITGPAAILAIGTFLRLVAKVGSDAFVAFKQFSGISTQAEKLAAIQDQIGQKLERNGGFYLQQLNAGKSIEQVQRGILASLREEAALRSVINKLAISASSPVLKAEAAKYNLSSRTLVPRGAGGILPTMVAEKRDVLRGVGGAAPTAEPVYVPRFNFGDRTGPVVVNTSEKIVENWMGGKGSAVLTQEMIDALGGEEALSAYGNVKNVSQGYTPNFASFAVAGGKVNLRKRGGDIILDEILAGFDQNGERMKGTGIVRQAFDIAVEEGKKMGAGNLIVDILNSKVAQSLNNNPKFAGMGPFNIGKIKIPLMGLAYGHVPSFNSGGITSEALKSFSDPKELLRYISSTGAHASKGSSRMFIDVGGGKGLKVAINKAGIAQNEKEFPILSNDYFAREQYGDILPQGYEFDEDKFMFGFVEKLGKVGANQFKKLAGKGKRAFGWNLGDSPEGSFGYKVNDFIRNYDLRNDFGGGRNIGLGNDGQLKLMDIGFDDRIANEFYRHRNLGKFADGFVPSLAMATKVGGNRYLKTDAGSFLKYEYDKEGGTINLNYVTSNRKGDAYEMFGDLLKRSKRTGMPISSGALFAQMGAHEGNNWERFLKRYPQIRYRMRDDATTSGETATGLQFRNIDDLKNLVMSSKVLPRLQNITTRALAEGHVPSFNAPLKDAVSREIAALVEQGFSPTQARNSIRVDSSSVLAGPGNPLGLGVFNTAQGQTSLTKAFADHGGQNLKTVGLANGHVPNLTPMDDFLREFKASQLASDLKKVVKVASEFATNIALIGSKAPIGTTGIKPSFEVLSDLRDDKGRFVGGGVQSQINKNIETIATSSLPKRGFNPQVAQAGVELGNLKALLNDESAALVHAAEKKAFEEFRKNSLEFQRSDLATSKGFASNSLTKQVNNLISIAARSNSPTVASQAQQELAKLESQVSKGTFERIKKNFTAALAKGQSGRDATSELGQNLLQKAQEQIASRGFFSTQTGGSIFRNLEGKDKLPQAEFDALQKQVSKDARADRGQKFRNASLGFSIGASIAAPFVDQGAAKARENGETGLANALGGTSAALTGVSLLAAFGPIPALVGGVTGALYGFADALDQTDENATKLTTAFEQLSAKNAGVINGFSNYIQVQDRLNTVIEQGGKEADVQALSQELSRVFASISDPNVRKDIISTGGSIEGLTTALAKAQKATFASEKNAAAIAIAAQERDKATTLGFRGSDTFSTNSISSIAQTLVSSAGPKKLEEFGKSIAALENNLTQEGFVSAMDQIGIKSKEAGQFFEDLLSPLNRLALLRNIKEEINIAKDLEEMANKMVKAKTAVTDLNRTLSAIVSIQSVNGRTNLELQGNRFAIGQNAARNAAGNKFFNASEFASSQLSTAFDIQGIRFNAASQRAEANNQLKADVSGLVTGSRTELQSDPELLKALERLATTGQGDLPSLIERAFAKGTASGRNEKTFVEIANVLNNANNNLISINDKERTQVTLAQQNLAAAKERIAIEARVGVLGGIEGQLGFGTKGIERLKDRDINTILSRRGGEVGAFGRNENAQGILEFQKAFGGVDGLDIRTLIPNAQSEVAAAIKESLIQGLGRSGVELNGGRLDEVNRIAELSAAKQFERRELTAEEIGKAVGANVTTEKFAEGTRLGFSSALTNSTLTTHAGYVPQIYNFLKARFNLESDRASQLKNLETARKDATSTSTQINQAQAEIARAQREFGVVKGGNVKGAFDPAIVSAVNKNDFQRLSDPEGRGQAIVLQATVQETEAKLNKIFSKELVGGGGNVKDLEKRVNDVLKPGSVSKFFESKDTQFFREALQTQLGKTGVDDKGQVTTEGLNKIIATLQQSGNFEVQGEGVTRINQANQTIATATEELGAFEEKVKSLTQSIDALDVQIKAQKEEAAKKPQIVSTGAQAISTARFGATGVDPAIPRLDLSPGFFSRFQEEQKAKTAATIAKQREIAAANEASRITETNTNRFGPTDTKAIKDLERFLELENKDPSNRGRQQASRDAERVLLRNAQLQQFNTGDFDPALKGALRGVSPGTITQRLSNKNAEASFENIVDDAREAFVAGFVTDGDMKKVGIRIKQGLEDYTRTQIKLGVPEAEVRANAEKIRETIQKSLDKLQVRIPKNKIQEFGDGFSSEMENLQKSFDDFGALGAQTASDLTNGFGEAFFQIASGAQSAEDAIRGMLSGVAADLSKFFAKRAFAQIFAAAAGNSSAGSFGGFANGGVVKLAQGGTVPALVMGGERVFGPDTVRAYGVDFFKDLNAGKVPKKANGGSIDGMVTGGSGYKDDVFGNFPEGTFVLQKAAVNKYGKEYLDKLSEGATYAKGGRVQRAFWGALLGQIFSGALQGAVVGGVTAKVTGGDWKKGALLGGIGGGIAGGIGGYGFAKGNPNAGFGAGFKNGFSWLGGGNKPAASANGTPGSGTNALPSADSLKFDTKADFGLPTGGLKEQSLAALNGGNATGIGNQSLSAARTAVKPSIWKTAGMNLAVGAGLALLSSTMAPKTQPDGSKVIKGNGSITTYRPDGGININTSSGNYFVDRKDFNSTAQVEEAIRKNGGNLPAGGLPTFASGGEIASGSGSVAYKDRNILSQINKQFAQAYALGGYIKPKQPVGVLAMGGEVSAEEFSRPTNPYISMGSGTKDDVPIIGKKGEFMINDQATSFYGLDFLTRLNQMQLGKQDLGSRQGVLTMESGGPVEYNPADRDRGMFSLGAAPQPSGVAPRVGVASGGGDTNIEVNIHMNADGSGATVTTKSSNPAQGEDRNSIDSAKFAAKFKTMFLELVEQEKRPGGSLHKENA